MTDHREEGGGCLSLLVFGPFRLVWWTLVIATPVLGVWIGSSLAAYMNGPRWLVILAGALLFPVLPLAWEWVAWSRKTARAKEKSKEYTPLLSFWDRTVLRTLLLNVVFLGALLAYFPKESFVALSTRGDWPLDGQDGEQVERARGLMLQGAERLEWIYELAHENAYESYANEGDHDDVQAGKVAIVDIKGEGGAEKAPERGGGGPTKKRGVEAVEGGGDSSKSSTIEVIEGTGNAKKTDGSKPADVVARAPGSPPAWPMPGTLHPLVANMPENQEVSIEAVARYIAGNEKDPFMRVKALHDYVADRIVYDVASLRSGNFAPQNAEAVFRSGKAVCAGYSTLLAELGRYAGVEIVVLTGESRQDVETNSSVGHAWSAAKIEGAWYLMDATWNAGHVNGDTFTKKYKTDYLFTPPEIFVASHLPKSPKWQLLAQPITRAQFARKPKLDPAFFGHGLELVSPKRSTFEAKEKAVIELRNPRQKALTARIAKPNSSDRGEKCDAQEGIDVTITCPLGVGPESRIVLFAGEYNATLWSVAEFTVQH